MLVIDDLSTGRLDRLAGAIRLGPVTVHQMDIRGEELSEAAAKFEPEVVFHLAAAASVRASVDDPLHDASVNVLGTVNVLLAARDGGARKVVFVSSGGAMYGQAEKLPATERTARKPQSPYGVSKKVVEDYFRLFKESFGLDYLILAPSNIYGPRQDPHGEAGVVSIFGDAMLSGKRPHIFGDGQATRDYLFVEDTVDACIKAAHKGSGRLFNIGTGVETSVLELFEVIASEVGFKRPPEMVAPRAGNVERSALDASMAKKHLDWEPFTPLDDGIRSTVEWLRSRS